MKSLSIYMVARVGRSIGLGHWGRSLNLAKEFSRRSHKVYLEAIPVEPDDQNFLPEPYLQRFDGKIDIQVIDDPLWPISLIKDADLRIAIDFFKDPADLIHIGINAIDRTPSDILKNSHMVRLVGMDYLLVDSESENSIQEDKETKNLLMIMGGKDVKRLTLPILKLLFENQSLEPFTEIKVIVNDDHPEYQLIKKLIEVIPRAKMLSIQKTLIPLLQWSNLVICNGGMIGMLTVLQDRNALFIPQAKEEEELLAALQVNPMQVLPLRFHNNKEAILKSFTVASTTPQVPLLKIDSKGCSRVAEIAERYFTQ